MKLATNTPASLPKLTARCDLFSCAIFSAESGLSCAKAFPPLLEARHEWQVHIAHNVPSLLILPADRKMPAEVRRLIRRIPFTIANGRILKL
jgi:hypothetical protein